METAHSGSDVLFILLGGIMVLAMHSGFAFLELGTVRQKNQVNALVKILVDFAVSTIAYFFVGYALAYGVNFFSGVETLMEQPALMSFYELTSEQRQAIGIPENLVRLSVGLEDPDDLIADFTQSLARL